MVIVWQFEDAPKELQHSVGGDEDYIIATIEYPQVARQIAEKLAIFDYGGPFEVLHLGFTFQVFITTHS